MLKKTLFKKKPHLAGFTLIELMISLSLLAFIGYYTSQSLKFTSQRSRKLQKEMDLSSEVKAATRVIKSDISKAFNTRDIFIALYNEAQRERIREWQKKQQNQNSKNPNDDDDDDDESRDRNQNQQQMDETTPPPYEPRDERIVTQFLGEAHKINLTTVSGVKFRKNTYASDLIELGYYLDDCRKRGKPDAPVTQCLWRRISYYLDGEVDVGGEASVLLEDVTSFNLSYMRQRSPGEFEWINRWFSNQEGDDVSRNALPLAVRLELEVKKAIDKNKENTQKFSTQAYIPIYFTNNQNVKNIMEMNAQGNPLQQGDKNSSSQKSNTNPFQKRQQQQRSQPQQPQRGRGRGGF